MNGRPRFYCAVLGFYSMLMAFAEASVGNMDAFILFLICAPGWFVARRLFFPTDKDNS